MTDAAPIESRLAAYVQAWSRLRQKFETGVPVEGIVWKCKHTAPKAPQPPGVNIIPGVGGRNSYRAECWNIERTAATGFRLEAPQWIIPL